MAQKFRKALELVSKDDGLTEADHAHLARWGADGYPEDPLWEKLATDARARGMLPPNAIYPEIIREALVMRRHAESVRSGTDFELRERQQRRDHLLDLAKKADDLAEYYKWAAEYPGIESYFMRFLKPVSELQELHQKEAELLRQRAGRQPKPAARVSRQDRSKGRTGLRKIIAFIDLADCYQRDWLSEEPDYEAVVAALHHVPLNWTAKTLANHKSNA